MAVDALARIRSWASWPFLLLCLLLALLWLAGGASRADALGQVVVRLGSALILIVAVLVTERPPLGVFRPLAVLLGAALVLAAAQLVPLPPALWSALPGRALLLQAADLSGQAQPWRPLSMVPGATLNALASLIVPITALALMLGLRPRERDWTLRLVMLVVMAATLVALAQVSGGGSDNPLINDEVGEVSGTFANRNHLALLLALGCLIVPAWALEEGGSRRWRGPAAIGLVLLFVLVILATGSRVGLILGLLALLVGVGAARKRLQRVLRRYPKWVLPALLAGLATLIAIGVLASVEAGRAMSIQRALMEDPEQDMRRQALPVVWGMTRTYFPAGTGLGSFDAIFRIHEPFALLDRTYFNHAHSDLIEIVLDAGAPGLLLLVVAVGWWLRASAAAWRGGGLDEAIRPKLGSAALLLMLIASAFDYPIRTPLLMAVMVIAASWLAEGRLPRGQSALPARNEHL